MPPILSHLAYLYSITCTSPSNFPSTVSPGTFTLADGKAWEMLPTSKLYTPGDTSWKTKEPPTLETVVYWAPRSPPNIRVVRSGDDPSGRNSVPSTSTLQRHALGVNSKTPAAMINQGSRNTIFTKAPDSVCASVRGTANHLGVRISRFGNRMLIYSITICMLLMVRRLWFTV